MADTMSDIPLHHQPPFRGPLKQQAADLASWSGVSFDEAWSAIENAIHGQIDPLRDINPLPQPPDA